MKYILFLSLFSSTLLFSFEPKVGDFVKYYTTFEDRFGVNRSYTTHEIVRISGGQFKKYSITRKLFNIDNQLINRKAYELQDFEIKGQYIDDIVEFCEKNEGKLENLVVYTKSYEACLVSTSSSGGTSWFWFAQDIPFGTLKSKTLSRDKETIVTKVLYEYK